jgi:hypothetical protein
MPLETPDTSGAKSMMYRTFFISALFSITLLAADKGKSREISGGNDVLDITATVFIDRADVSSLLGRDPGLDMIIVQVKVAPKADNKLQIWRDDFTLLSGRDGQRSQPLDPSQIAGRGALMVTQQGARRGGMMGQDRGPIWGGIPGTGGRPSRAPGNGGGIGTSPGTPESKTGVQSTTDENENPLLAALKEKVLPDKETNDPISGLLYFLFDGKPPKVKDLSLIYKGQVGERSILEFKP